HFRPTEVISSDYCRALVCDDESNQESTKDAFDLLHFMAAKRLFRGKLTVIDATNVQPESRKYLIELARKYHVVPVAIVFNIPTEICNKRNEKRPNRNFGARVVSKQNHLLNRYIKNLRKEGITNAHFLNSVEDVGSVIIERTLLWNNLKHEHGPFDIIGDVHGCFNELYQLLLKLGYEVKKSDRYIVTHKEGRKVIFVGDLVDRGPNTPDVLRIVMDMVGSDIAFCVVGNHDDKLKRKLLGKNVKIAHGLEQSLLQLENESQEFKLKATEFLDKLVSHYVFDDGNLAVSHAGLKQEYIGRGSPQIRAFCMYGETTGEIDEFGLPVRYPWANDYRGNTKLVYGHTPVTKAEWVNNTIDIDTGCVFGGKLTALRYPEMELVEVKADKAYYASIKPLDYSDNIDNEILNIDDVTGKRIIKTELANNIIIREENVAPALEVMSRFAVDPRWLIYLPPTMSPSETSSVEGLLEHPLEVFNFYRSQNVNDVICEEKHMGSRAIVIVCKNDQVAKKRFGINSDEVGICYTRTGRRFFNDIVVEQQFLTRVARAITIAQLWEEFNTEWICFDCELMPWSAKATALLEEQYAPVATAADVALADASLLLSKALDSIEGIAQLYQRTLSRQEMASLYRSAYQRYCWNVDDINDFKLAPFHILAFEDSVNMEKDHLWHLEKINKLCNADPEIFRKTPYKLVNINDSANCEEATSWWHELTQNGGEGMVVKPLDFTVIGKKGLIQPGIKCRGKEYLRIIYGPEYTVPENLLRLRSRSLNTKRSLALREYALGHEALKRFIDKEPLFRVHEAVFGILALETDPVDPRL
ncbi:MAG: polynucleotide kinase-phosphatase, partial [Neisseriaceae bacterium]